MAGQKHSANSKLKWQVARKVEEKSIGCSVKE